jgi:ABC-type nitrate/sulfonate/bicarbonate transport system substrate-binding protein
MSRRFYSARLWFALLSVCLAASVDAAPIRIAYSSISAAMLPLFVAKDKKLFDKQGLDVELTYIRGVAIEALIAGEVQFVRASPPSVIRSTLRGADLAVIANKKVGFQTRPYFAFSAFFAVKNPNPILSAM